MLEQMGASYHCEVIRTPQFRGKSREPLMEEQGDGSKRQAHETYYQCTIRRDHDGAVLFRGKADNEKDAINDAFEQALAAGIPKGPRSDKDVLEERLKEMESRLAALTKTE